MKVGFVGETGSGKSTLLDIIMGLLTPTNGGIYVDGLRIDKKNIRAWQSHIAHVPQNIYLSDGTIEENIAFGIPKKFIDRCRVEEAAQKAQLLDLIYELKDGYQTLVGESGARLSGGQRQRIGIARAMYKKADVLIFDEATSALDNDTERKVMCAINDLNCELTIFIIAHRVGTLKGCDKIVKVDNNNIYIGSYQDIISSKD
jgi:ATP-binding cassette subfamily B protein